MIQGNSSAAGDDGVPGEKKPLYVHDEVVILRFDRGGNIVSSGGKVRETFGYSGKESLGLRIHDISSGKNRPMRVALYLLAALIALSCPRSAAAGPGPGGTRTILHVNDFHGRMEPAPAKPGLADAPTGGAALLAGRIRQERGKDPAGTVLLSAGDMFQGTPASNLFHGAPVLEIMNSLSFDAMTLGNHEFDWGLDVLGKLRAGASFPFLSATVVDNAGRPLPGISSYVLLERKGARIAVVGVSTPDTPYTTKRDNVEGLVFLDPVSALPKVVRQVRSLGADVVVVLSHLGFDEDRKVAMAVPGIDLIVGGHTHTAVTKPVRAGGTLVAQAGSHGMYLGVVRIEVGPKGTPVFREDSGSGLLPVSAASGVPEDPEASRIVGSYRARLAGEFRRVVGTSGVDLVRDDNAESNVGNLLCDAARAATGADVAFMNAYGIRADLPRGEITLEQVYTMLPFENTLLTVELTGRGILSALERGATLESGMLQVSGAEFRVDLSKPAGSRVSDVLIGGAPLDPEKKYRAAMNDFLAAGGDRFDAFREGTGAAAGGSFRDAVLEYLRTRSPVSPRVEGRITVVR
jgi:2',3'-cyclic-nucleotide 2'-phosphodiesterase (5'-nucleotidase family)